MSPKFCRECGNDFQGKSPKFCPECGVGIADISSENRFDVIPNGISAQALSFIKKSNHSLLNAGQVNVEGGRINIESRIFKGCECESEVRNISPCEECGRSTLNSKSLRAGPGDGLYNIWSIVDGAQLEDPRDRLIGFNIWFDYNFTGKENASLKELPSGETLHLYDFGSLEISNEITVGESGAQVRAATRLGKYRVLAFCEIDPPQVRSNESAEMIKIMEKSFRESGLGNDLDALGKPLKDLQIVVPYVVLVVHEDFFAGEAHAWAEIMDKAIRPNLVELHYGWMIAIENSNPSRIENIAVYNNSLNSFYSKSEQISWLLEGREIGDVDCIERLRQEIKAGFNLTTSLEIELLCRRGYIWRGEEIMNAQFASEGFDPVSATNVVQYQYFVEGAYEKALNLLNLVIEKTSGTIKAHANALKITCLAGLGRFDDLIEPVSAVGEIISALPQNNLNMAIKLDALYRYSEFLELAGRIEDAIEGFTTFVDLPFLEFSRRAKNEIRRLARSNS
jgi:tetratricopeptide (TPR) repeat protein